MGNANYSAAVKTARNYYNSSDADRFYLTLWGGRDLHIGLYKSDEESVLEASNRTTCRMAELVADRLVPGARVLDVGGGFGGTVRFLAREYDGVQTVSLNLSGVQNERARERIAKDGLADSVSVVEGNFEDTPFDSEHFDVVWSQDAMLHSGNRAAMLSEVARVLKPGGVFIFTDPMAADGVSFDTLQPVLGRLDLKTMGSPEFYRDKLTSLGLDERLFEEHADQLVRHYQRIHDELVSQRADLQERISDAYLENMKTGLRQWVDSGRAGRLTWGIMVFDKKQN